MTGRLVIYILAGLSVVCFTAVFLIGAVRRLRSRGEEAGAPDWREPIISNWASVRDDELALAKAAELGHFAVWEAECSKLQRLADKLGTRS